MKDNVRKFKPGDKIRQRYQHNAYPRTVLSWQHDDPDVVLVHCSERGPNRVISVFAWSHDLVPSTDEDSV